MEQKRKEKNVKMCDVIKENTVEKFFCKLSKMYVKDEEFSFEELRGKKVMAAKRREEESKLLMELTRKYEVLTDEMKQREEENKQLTHKCELLSEEVKILKEAAKGEDDRSTFKQEKSMTPSKFKKPLGKRIENNCLSFRNSKLPKTGLSKPNTPNRVVDILKKPFTCATKTNATSPFVNISNGSKKSTQSKDENDNLSQPSEKDWELTQPVAQFHARPSLASETMILPSDENDFVVNMASTPEKEETKTEDEPLSRHTFEPSSQNIQQCKLSTIVETSRENKSSLSSRSNSNSSAAKSRPQTRRHARETQQKAFWK